jgi:photosystem II stability/assembly factor-like uncharacterized protein
MFFRQTIIVTSTFIFQNVKLFSCLLFLSLLISNCKPVTSEAEEKLETDGADRAMHQEFLMTRDPALNIVPKERLLTALNYMNSQRTTQPSALTWQERGPNNIGGRSRAIMIDKRDPTGNTVFAASVSGGIFKTTNFLSNPPTWAPVNDQMANLAVTILLQDKNNLNTMYAGTGEGWFNIDAVRGAGIFRSTDGGTTWSQIASTSGFEYVQDMIIDNNNNLYVALRNLTTLNRGVMRSTDGGTTWTQVLGLPLTDFAYTTGRAADLEVASNGDVFATMGIFTRTMVFKSSFVANGALTGAVGHWTEITPPHTTITFRAELAVAPNNPLRIYLMMQDSVNDQVDSFYRSNDGGANWTPLLAPSALNNDSNSQVWYDLTMAVDSNNADIVVVGGLQVAKSTDGGTSWSTISASPVHVDQHYLVYFNSSRLLLGNDGGLYYSNDVNLPSPSWVSKNATGYNVTQFYGCDFHPTDDNYFLAGAQDNNTQKFTIAGMNGTTAVVGGDGGVPHIHQTDGLIQIASTTGNNYYRSTTGGTAFSFLSSVSNNRGQFINPTDYDNTNNIMYCGDDAGQYYLITGLAGTATGTIKSISGTIATREVTAVKVDPVTPTTVWLGCSLGGAVPMVCKISNANTTPSVDLSSQIPVAANAYISCIDVEATNANHILVTLSNFGVTSIWESTNGGTSWNNIEGNLPDMPVHWGIFAPSSAILSGSTGGGILLGTELGVWTTSAINGVSTNWVANNSGLANVPVYMLRYKSSTALVAAATHGRGLFTTILPGVATGVSNNVLTKDFIKYISADQSRLLIVKGSLTTKKMQVQIFDASGKLVYDQNKPYQDASINISLFSAGSYTVRMIGNNKEYYVRQFVKGL